MAALHPEVVRLLRSLLDVVDNLERAIEAAERDPGEVAQVHEGVRGIHRQLSDLLYRYGVRSFASQGTPFDPARHEALGQVPSDTIPARYVAEEIQRGYFVGDDLFRAARVLVSAEETRELPAANLLSPEVAKPTSQPRPQRSAASRPAWLLNPPTSTERTVYAVGQVSGAPSVEAGQERAKDAAVGGLLAALLDTLTDEALERTCRILHAELERQVSDGLWQKLESALPEAEQWVEDYYWEQVKGEIRGTAYDVAVLLALGAAEGQALLVGESQLERWGGLVFVDTGPLLGALVGSGGGALLIDTHLGGIGTRFGLQPGDVVTRVANRPTVDAASARRILSLSGTGRRPFEVEFTRGLGQPQTVRVDPVRR